MRLTTSLTKNYSVAKAIAVNPNSQSTSLLRRRAQLLILLIALLMSGMKGWGQSTGFNNTFFVLSLNGGANTYYDLNAATGNTDFNGANLGSFVAGTSNLVFKGAEHNVFKCGGADISSTRVYYRIYLTSAGASGAFTSNNITYTSGFNNGCGGQDQKWDKLDYSTNLLSGLAPGNYSIQVYSDASTTLGDRFASNGGSNYTATFTVTGNYYSKSTGNLELTSSWGTNTDGTGNAPANFTTAGNTFNIRNNATPTIGAAWTVSGAGSKVVVGDGTNACTLTLPSGTAIYTSTATDVSNNATIKFQNATAPTFGTTQFLSGSVYEHNLGSSGGTIPTATWNSNSTCRLKYTANTSSSPSGLSQTFGKFEIDLAAGQTNNNLVITPTNVTNEFRVTSTGGGSIELQALVIDGNYVQTGGTAKVRAATGSSSANVKGSFTLSGGSFMITDANGSGNQSQLTVDGACSLNGGTFSFLNTSGTSGVAFMILRGTTTIGSGVTFGGFLITTSGFYFNRASPGTTSVNIAHPFSSGTIRNAFYYNTTNVTGINETYNGTSAQTTVNGTNATPGVGYAAWPTTGTVIKTVTISNTAGVTASVAKVINTALVVAANCRYDIGANAHTIASGATGTINGTLRSAATITTTGTLTFSSTGTYEHNFTTTAGVIPTATWSSGSTCSIIGYTNFAGSANTSMNQTFSNFTWNCPNQTVTCNIQFNNITPPVINGNFTVSGTGSGVLRLGSSTTYSLTIGGDLIISSSASANVSTLNLSNGSAATVGIAGNINITQSGTGVSSLTLGTGSATVNFNKNSGTQTFSSNGTISGSINWNVGNGTTTNTLQLGSNVNLGSGTGTFTVANNASLDFQTFTLSGSGTFAASTGSTLISANTNATGAFNTTGANGSVQTTTRTFSNAGVNYTFNGASAQNTGNAIGSATNTNIKNLTINNSSGVTLSSSAVLSATGTLTFTNGSLTLGANDLTLTSGASISGASSARFVKTTSTGQLKQTVGGSTVTFPVGNAAYNPISFSNSGLSDVYGVIVVDGALASTYVPNAVSKTINRRWEITEAVAGGGTITPAITFNLSERNDATAFTSASTPYVGLFTSSWSHVGATSSGSDPLTFTAGSSFSPSTSPYSLGCGKDDGLVAIACTQPSTQAAIGSYTSNTTGTSITVNWTRGNGNGVIVVARATSNAAVDPSSGTTYTANAAFGSGGTTGANNFVVYSGTGTSVAVTNLTGGTSYTFTVYEYNTTGTCYKTPGSGSAVTICTSGLAVSIAASPSGAICTGTNVTFTATPANGGASPSYQWKVNGNNVGANSTSYSSSSLANGDQVTCVITNSASCSTTATSNTIAMTVDAASAGGTVSGSTSVCTGTNSTNLSLSGNTGSVTKWQSSTVSDFSSSVTDISNTTTSLTATNLTTTTYYRAVVTNGACPAANSLAATITVDPASVGGSATPASGTICTGSSTSVTVSGYTGTIQWQQSANGSTGWANVTGGSGATSATYTTPNLTSTTYYRAVVTSGVCVAANSSTATVSIDAASVGGTATPATSPLCTGSSTTVTVSGYTGTIQWQQSANGSTGWANVTGGSGETSATYTTPNLTSTTYYRAVVTNGVCTASNSSTATVTVNASSSGGTATATLSTLCTGSSTTINLSGSSGSIQWQQSADGSTGWGNVTGGSGATTATYTTPNLSSTTYYRAVVTSGVCSSSNSSTASVTVISSVGGTASAGSSSVCLNGSTSISLSGQTGATIQWQRSEDAGSSWSNITGATSTSYSTPNLITSTSYRAVVTNGSCASANSASTTVSISQSNTSTAGASTYDGSPGWDNNDNDGVTGMGAWALNPSSNGANSGFYISSAGDVNIKNGGTRAWALYGKNSATSSAVRTLSMSVGNTVSFSMDNGSVNGTIGAGIQNASGENLMEIIFVGGESFYKIVDNAGSTATTVGYTTGGLDISISYTAENTYSIFITGKGGATTSYTSRTFSSRGGGQVPAQIRFFNFNAGDGGNYDLFFNSLSISNPLITTHPSTTAQNVCQNGSATALSVTASGTSLSYQWYSNTSASNSGGTSIGGANASSYTPSSATAGTLYYYCVVTNGSCGSATSRVSGAVTVVTSTTSISPATAQNISVSTNGTQLTVSAGTATVSSRAWKYSTTSGSGYVAFSPAQTGTTYTPNFASSGTYYVVCEVTYNSPCSTVTSNEVQVVVVANTITTGSISGSSFCAGATGVSVPFTYAAAGNFPSATFKAQLSNASGSFASPVDLQTVASDATGSQSISVTIPSNTTEGTGYRIRVVSDNPALNGTDNGSNLTINVASVGGSIAGGTTVCTGTNSTNLTLSGHTGSVTKWQSSTASDFSASVTDISNTSTSLTATNLTATTYYRAVVTNGACSAANSSSATITVSASSVGGTVSGGSAICLGSTSAQLSLSGNTGSVTKWQSSPSPYTTWTDISNTSTTYTSGALSQTTQFRAVVTNGACSAANSSATTVAVDQSNADASAYGSSWASSSNDAATGLNSWVLLTSGTSGHFTGNSDIDVNSKAWGMYASGGGEANAIRPFSNNLTTGSTIHFSIDNGSIQNGGVVGFSLRNSSSQNLMEFYFTGGTSFYTINDNAGSSLTSVPYTGTGLRISISYTAAYTYSMSVTPAAGGTTTYFSGRTFSTTGSSNQVPREVRFFNFNAGSTSAFDFYLNSISLNRPAIGTETNFGAQTLCQDATPNTLSVTAYGSGLTYQWYQNTSASTSGASSIPSANSSSYTPSTSSAGTLYYYCIVSGTCSSVRSNFSGAVTVSGTPTTANAGPDQTASATCGLTSVTLAANTPTVGTGAWSIVSGAGGTITTPSSPTSTFTGTAGTTYTLRWTITSSPCSASTDDVVITFNQNPTTANAGPDQTGSATCGLTSVTLAGNTPTVGTGAWSIVSGTGGTITSPSSATSTFTGTAGSTYTLRWTISNSPCTASTDDVVITFNQNPTTANAGADQTGSATCGQTSVTLAGNTPTVGTGAWTIVSGTGGSLGDASSPTSSFSGTAGVTYTLRWTISSGSCTASTDDVDIAFNQNPTTANAGADQTGSATCGQTSVTLAGNTPTVGTGAWSIVSGAGGTITTPSSPTSTFTGTAGTTYTLRWTISNNPCTASTDDVVITFNQSPTTANAGADQIGSATCGSTSVTLSANTPTVGTGAWTIVSGTGGSFGDASSPTSTFSGTSGTTYTLRWTISNSPCTASSDDVTIALNQNPAAANAGADQTDASTCGLTTVNLAANTPSTGSGVWSIVSGTGGTITTPSSPTSTFSGTAGSTYTLRWTISNSPCTASTDDVIITFNQNPTTANAGADQTGAATCGLTSVTLAGNTPTVGTGSWSIITGSGGTVTSPSSPTSTFSGTAGSTYTLRWSISNGSCTASTDDVLVTFNQNPTTANAGPDQNVCSGASATLAANAPTVGTGAWTVVSGAGGSFGNASSPTSSFSGTTGTTYTLRWTISNSPCTASTDDVVITVSGAVNYGTVGNIGNLVISQVYGGGGNAGASYNRDFVEIYNPTSSAVSLVGWTIQYAGATGTSWSKTGNLTGSIGAGNYYLVRMTTTGTTGSALPTPDFSNAVSIDMSAASGKVALVNNSTSLTGSCPTDASIIDFVGYGTANCFEGSGATGGLSATTAAIRKASGCTNTLDNASDFTVTTPSPRNSSTAANICTSSNETICSGSVPTSMSVSGASGSGSFTYQWYYQTGAVSTPTGSSTTGWTTLGSTDGANTATYTPTSGLSSTTTYACFVTPGGSPSCGTGTWASGSRIVYVNTVSGGTVAADQTICSGGNPAAFTTSVAASAAGTLTYQWESSTASNFASVTTIGGATSATYDAPAGITTTTYYRLKATSVLNGVTCSAYSNVLTVTVNAAPTVTGTTSVCVGLTTQLSGSGTPSASSPWSSNSANATVNSTGLVTGVTAGTATITYTDVNGCQSAGTTVTVNALPTVSFTTSPAATLCSATSATYTTQSGQSNYIWSVPGTLNTDYTIASGGLGTSSNTVTINWLTAGSKTVTVNYTNSNNCTAVSPASSTTTVTITPTTSNAGVAQSICSNGTATLAANTPSVGTGAWTVTSGPSTSSAQFSSTSNPGAVFTPAGGAGSYVLTWTISNGSCTSTSTVTITVNAIPATTGVTICQGGSGSLAATDVCSAFVNSGTTIAGSFASTPTANRLNTMSNSATCSFSTTITRNYTAIQFQVSVTGTYGFLMDDNLNYDGAGYITSGSFVPGTCPGAGVFIKGDDDGGATSVGNEPYMTASLTAGVTYTLYSLTYSSTSGSTTGSFSWTVTPPSGGEIMLNNNAVVNWYTAASGGSVIGTGTSFNPVGVAGSGLANTNTAGTYTYYAACSNSTSCRAAADFVITGNPTTANAGPDQTGSATCGETTVTLAANTPTVGTGVWSIVSGTGGAITTPSSPTSTFAGVAGSTYVLRWTISNSPCSNSSDEVTITFNRNPTTADAGPDQLSSATCGSTQITLAANTPTVGTGSWSVVSGDGNGSFGNASSPTSTFNGTAGVTYTLRWTISNSPCTASTDDVQVSFNLNPPAANAGADQTGSATCGLTSVTLAANTPSYGTGTWSVVSGTGGSFGDVNSPTSSFSGTAGVTYTLRWSINNSPCTASTDDVIITFNVNPTLANAGADQAASATCGLTTVTLAGNVPTTGTGSWSVVSGTGGSFGNASSATSTFSGTAGSSYALRWTITNGACSSSDDMLIIFNLNPTTANAGPDQTGLATCSSTQITLAANTPTIGSGSWSIVSGTGGSFGDSNSPTSTFSGIAGETYTLRWTISNSPCSSSTDDVVITLNQAPTTANAGSDQTGSATCGQTSVTLAGNTPSVGSGSWSIVSGTGGTITTPSSPTSTFSGTAGSSYTLRWTISNSPCSASTDDVVITFNQNPTTANAGADQTGSATCGLTSVTLAANTPTVGTGSWSVVSGSGGSFGDASSPTSTFSGTSGVTYTLRWTISNTPCTASTDDMVVTFNQNPSGANAGADQTGSATCGLTSVTLAATPPAIGSGTWSIISGVGGSLGDANSPTSSFSGTAGTTYTLRWTVSNASCTATTDDMVVTFNRNPTTANAGADQTGSATCGLTSVTLAANSPVIGTGSWSIVSGTGGSFSISTNPSATFSGTAGSTYTLRWTISNSPCTASTDDVVITFNKNPTTANAGADQTGSATCNLTEVTLAGNEPVEGTGIWSIVSGSGGSFGDVNSATSTFTGTAGVTYTLRWTISNSPCTASTDDVVVTFNVNPTPANAGTDITQCGSTTFALSANSPSVGTGAWSVVSGSASLSNASLYNTNATLTSGSSAVLRWTITNGACSSYDDVEITYDAGSNESGTWKGTASSDWDNPANWGCNTLPNSSANIVIEAGASNYPVFNSTQYPEINSLTINTGATFTMTGSSTLTINSTMVNNGTLTMSNSGGGIVIGGNWNNNGTVNPGASTLTFNGSGSQTLGGSVSTQPVNNLVINKPGQTLSLINVMNLNVSGDLTLTAGQFITSGITSINMSGGNWTNNGGTFTPGGSTVVFNGTSNQEIGGTTSAEQLFANITMNKASGSLTFATDKKINVSGNLALTQGSFVPAAGTTVAFDKSGNQNIPVADYYHLKLSNGGTKVLANNTAVAGDLIVENPSGGGATTVTPGNVIKFNGNNNQNIAGLDFKKVEISGTGGFTKRFTSNASIDDAMTFEGGTGTVDLDGASNNLLFTVKSTASATARVGNIGSWSVTGKAVVERYVPSQRKWRLISVPTVPGETLRQALTRQIDGSYPNPVCFTADAQAGSGTLITGHSMSSCTNATSVGFDHLVSGGASSIRFYNSGASNPWNSATSTPNVLAAPTQSGYLAFIRGDRQTLNSGSSVTTLRPKGDLIQGNYNIPYSSSFFVLGNPYASPISFESLYEFGVENGNATKIKRTFWIWDANLTNSTGGVGGYRVVAPNDENVENPSYTVTPALPGGTTINDFLMINSGQAILVERRASSGAGNVVVKESHKLGNNGNLLNLRTSSTDVAKIKVDMYRANGSTLEMPMDGVVARFADWYDAEPTDIYDVYKNNQFEENLSLVRKDAGNVSRYLSIESRPAPTANDTIFMPFYQMSNRGYALKFNAENMASAGLNAYLQDQFTATEREVPLNGSDMIYPFSVTSDANSKALTRFRIVFRPTVITDVVDWMSDKGISIYPNPVVKGTDVQVQFRNSKSGKYDVTIYSLTGIRILQTQVVHPGGSSVQKTTMPAELASGTYIMEFTSPNGDSGKTKLIVQ